MLGVTPAHGQSKNIYRQAFDDLDAGRIAQVRPVLYRGGNPILTEVLKAEVMAQPGQGFSFEELRDFVLDHPRWPGLKGVIMMVEQSMTDDTPAPEIISWFEAQPPLTPLGFYRYMEALESSGQVERATSLIKARWAERNFTNDDFAAYVARYAKRLKSKDHQARLDRLLWENNATAAQAMLVYVDEGHKALARARLALAAQKKDAENLAMRVPSSLKNDEGLLYERLRMQRKNNRNNEAIKILDQQPKKTNQPDKWWNERHIMIRRLIEDGYLQEAWRLADGHGLYKEGLDFAQASFLAGWLALRFLERPDLAYPHFSALLSKTSMPVSRARGYYWMGRAYELAGQNNDAQEVYKSAAAYPTTFYGQLGYARLYKNPVLQASLEPSISSAVRAAFFKKDEVQAIAQLYALDETMRAQSFFRALCDHAQDRVEYALLLELAYRVDRPDWAVVASKAASQKGYVLTGGAYPVLSTKIPRPPELALSHALIRQESHFKTDAGSAAGARGLMQLMPATAREVAKKLDIPFNPSRLTDPDYNVRLGTHFIKSQIDKFEGSYVLALAAYNAGPSRVRQWINTYGDPRDGSIDVVDWIELIPIYETRNYVHRILENLQYYRARLNNGKAPLQIVEDLNR